MRPVTGPVNILPYAFKLLMMVTNSSAFNEAPPTRPPSTSGCENNSLRCCPLRCRHINGNVGRNGIAIFRRQHRTKMRMHFLRLFTAGSFAGTDGPDWFVLLPASAIALQINETRTLPIVWPHNHFVYLLHEWQVLPAAENGRYIIFETDIYFIRQNWLLSLKYSAL